MSNRPEIPDAIKREVRQRCGFGCVICGIPLYEYDHTLGWAETQAHVAAEITLLCPRHHSEKTKGLLTVEQVQEASGTPYNLRTGVTSPYLLQFTADSQTTIAIGGSLFLWNGPDMAAIVVDDEALVGFHREDGRLLFRMLLKDELNQPVLVVDRSELRIRADAWDVEFVGQTLTVRNGPGDIFLEMRIEPPSTVTIERARILSNGAVFMIGNEGITIGSSLINIVNGIYLRSVGIVVGFSPNFGRGYAVNRYEWIASR